MNEEIVAVYQDDDERILGPRPTTDSGGGGVCLAMEGMNKEVGLNELIEIEEAVNEGNSEIDKSDETGDCSGDEETDVKACNDDLAPAGFVPLLAIAHGDMAYPIRLPEPGLDGEGAVGDLDVGGLVEEADDVVAIGGLVELNLVEEVGLAVVAVFGARVAVEGVVGSMVEVAVAEDEPPEVRVERVEAGLAAFAV